MFYNRNMRDEEGPLECPNCKQMSVQCQYSKKEQIVKCTKCKCKLKVSYKYVENAPGHEEHDHYKAIVKKA